jgi:hypothetical protein
LRPLLISMAPSAVMISPGIMGQGLSNGRAGLWPAR